MNGTRAAQTDHLAEKRAPLDARGDNDNRTTTTTGSQSVTGVLICLRSPNKSRFFIRSPTADKMSDFVTLWG